MPASPTDATVFLEIDDDLGLLQLVLEALVLALELGDLLLEGFFLAVLALLGGLGGRIEQPFLPLGEEEAKGGVVEALSAQDSSDLSTFGAGVDEAQDAAFLLVGIASARRLGAGCGGDGFVAAFRGSTRSRRRRGTA